MDFATPHIFATARDEPDDTDPRRGQKLEVKIFEARYNSAGTRVTLSAGIKHRNTFAPILETRTESALLVTRFYDRDKELEYTQMEIRSPYIRAALRAVIKEYPGLTFDTASILIRDEPRCIFHYRDELRNHGMGLEDETAVQHILYFLNYMYTSLSREVSSYYTFMESSTAAPGIEHEFLWMVFKPGSLLLHTSEGIKRVLRMRSMQNSSYVYSMWDVVTEKLAYDGDELGWTTEIVHIPWYDGYRPLEELQMYPLRYHPSQPDINRELVARGHRYLALRELSHRCYSGVADSLAPYRTTNLDGDEDYCIQPIKVSLNRNSDHRLRLVALDQGTNHYRFQKFALVRPTHKEFILAAKVVKVSLSGEPLISNEEWCLFDSRVPGFSLSAKRWCFFELDRTTEFEYNTRAFELLALPVEQKTMLSSLVNAHTSEMQFDDLVKGKGKGLIFLLHGEPGVGKTLTAESLSDYTRRPLYSISCGDLGTTAMECEKALVEILDLATGWNAVLLIDEADVFLEQRSMHDLVRNGVVAVFLRLLEYFEGIMFLTTNRIMNFDRAFKSRIHLAIKYPSLSESSQRQLWTTFITHSFQRPQPGWLNETLLGDLAARQLNGRQIKNVVHIALALSIAASRELEPNDIFTSLKAMEDFEMDFAEAVQENLADDNRQDAHSYIDYLASGYGHKRKRIE